MPLKVSSTSVIVVSSLSLVVLASFLHVRRQSTRRKPQPKKVHEKTTRPTLQDQLNSNECVGSSSLSVNPIGTIRSIYRLCVGTPRQGLLAPHARGKLELENSRDAVLGLEGYSHIWIVFIFHLNTISSSDNKKKQKISPPALGGQKIGVLATRSPHRFNPIGITLCKLDRIQTIKNTTTLFLSGLDLVDGTPVLDIKPYVGHYDSVEDASVPWWVRDGLATRRPVVISDKAQEELELLVDKLEFYETLEDIQLCIHEVLSIDVRSSFQTKKAREGKSKAERAQRLKTRTSENESTTLSGASCTQQLDNLLIHYSVSEASSRQHLPSAGSGAEDAVLVTSIQLLKSPT